MDADVGEAFTGKSRTVNYTIQRGFVAAAIALKARTR
jgi:hypothetical protein